MSSRNRNNYHWVDSNISEWCESFIKEELKNKNYEINEYSGDTFITQRMGRVGLIYSLNIKLTKELQKIQLAEFDEYSEEESISSKNKTFSKEVFSVIKMMENVGKEKFSHLVICNQSVPKEDNQIKISNTIDEIPKSNDKIPLQKHLIDCGNLEVSLKMNCSVEELKSFLMNKDFIDMWANKECIKNNGEMILYNRIFVSNLKESENEINMNWKFKEWEKPSTVLLILKKDGSHTIISIKQRNVPLKDIDSVKNVWIDYYFKRIGMVFGYLMETN